LLADLIAWLRALQAVQLGIIAGAFFQRLGVRLQQRVLGAGADRSSTETPA
jgi:hypothetical protein